ncbi:lipopolysaccharide biosynthesis protein [Butyrivibrio sp. MC2013]|uniref:lipopolysaccharide biosynthesis protein n=1 Tax=Butyrivibrio sp. MC2013 TaxID=1280686 RepID=UPI000411F6AE|nr:hypothetical protein [Butyrivibrio sp. MC2013]
MSGNTALLGRIVKKHSLRRDFMTNLIAEGISAAQSALILIFISASMSGTDAGIFSIGYALSTIIGVMTMYGVRNYQVSDSKDRYSFNDYFHTRLLTMAVSFLLLALYLIFRSGDYGPYKMVAIILICLWKNDSMLEDVFFGMYQKKGYLTLAAGIYALRLSLSTALFCILTFTGMRLVTILLVVTIFSYLATAIFLGLTYPFMGEKISMPGLSGIRGILIACAPLALAGVVGNYVGNAPKYSIDLYMDDASQAIFGYLIMPSFVILILANSVYRPVLGRLAGLYIDDRRAFGSLVFRLVLMVIAMGVVIVLAGSLIGIPVLSVFYHTDLGPYRREFILLLMGGSFYALASFGSAVLTSMTKTTAIAVSYGLAAIICVLSGGILVPALGLDGAVYQYLVCNLLLALMLMGAIVLNIFIKRHL